MLSSTTIRLRAVVLSALILPLACAAGEWELRLDGIGPLKVGMRFNEANARVHNTLERAAPALRESDRCDTVAVRGHPNIGLMFVDDVLRRVDVVGPAGRTATGVAIGDPVQRVFDTYPSVASSPNAYDESERYLTATSADGKLAIRFETDKGKVGNFYAGRFKEVQYIEGCL